MLEGVTQSLDNVEDTLTVVSSKSNAWTDQKTLLETYKDLKGNFQQRFVQSQESLAYIFQPDVSVEENTERSVSLINRWHDGKEHACISAILGCAMGRLGFSYEDDKPLIDGVVVSAILAEVPNALFYHNNLHFRKVVLHVIRMVVAHNTIFSGTSHCLSKEQISSLFIAAAIHDLGHQGKGNLTDREYVMARTEKRSYDLAVPYLKEVGFPDALLADIRTMLIATDVSPFGDPISPANQVRAAYEYHYGESEDADALELTEDLAVLESNPDLCMMCLMLHEADIMNSAGLSYEITRQESVLVSKEIGRPHASPEDTLLFLEKICCGEMLSDSARLLASNNLQDILARVMQDFKDGNKSYF